MKVCGLCESFLTLTLLLLWYVVDIPYHVSDDGDGVERADVDSLHYVDAAAVNIASSTSHTARYWETHRVAAPHDNAAAVSATRTTLTSLCSALLLLAVIS